MTGCQEKNSDFFLKLPLKELQCLCKTHDLPTNKTRVKLANLLALFFKNKNAYTSSLEDRSGSPVKASCTIPLSESQRKETVLPPEEGRRGAFEARTNSSECDSCKLSSGIKVAGVDRSHCQVGIQEPQLASDVISGPGKSEVVPQNSVDASRMETANSSVLDTLKPIPAVDVLNPDGNKNHDPRDGLVTTSIDSYNVEASSLYNIAVSFEQGVNIPDGRKLETSDIHNNDSTLCQVPMEKGATESLGTSENHLPSRQIQHVCGDHENSVAKESISAINADLGGCIAAKEIESLKCLESQSSPVRRPKRSYHSDFPSKSQHANSKNKRTMSLRSAKALERETFPRRSTRHIK